jgi:uncharacterized protein DUF1707/cell wall-active antibiotic response 4TMS protein YvqF
MSDLPELRVSDTDRERVALQLRDHAVEGRLTLEELSERLDRAYAARTLAELEPVTADLPAAAPLSRGSRRWSIVAFGDLERKGRWRLPRRSVAVVAFGNLDFDLRQAELEAETASITAFLLFGNVDVYVPEGIEVEVDGLVVLGHRREWGREPARPASPVVRLRVFALVGTADVWRVPRQLVRLNFREVIKALRRGDRALPRG